MNSRFEPRSAQRGVIDDWWRTNHGPYKPLAQLLPLQQSTIITRQSSIRFKKTQSGGLRTDGRSCAALRAKTKQPGAGVRCEA